MMTRGNCVLNCGPAAQENCEELFKKYNVKENLDNLHAVVTAARVRKQTEYNGKDVWREDLQPRAAVRARTIPVLEKERDRLRTELAQVSRVPLRACRVCVMRWLIMKLSQLTEENSELQSKMERNVQETQDADREASRLLDTLDEVSSPVCKDLVTAFAHRHLSTQALAKWDQMPFEDIQLWTLQAAESAGSKA